MVKQSVITLKSLIGSQFSIQEADRVCFCGLTMSTVAWIQQRGTVGQRSMQSTYTETLNIRHCTSRPHV